MKKSTYIAYIKELKKLELVLTRLHNELESQAISAFWIRFLARTLNRITKEAFQKTPEQINSLIYKEFFIKENSPNPNHKNMLLAREQLKKMGRTGGLKKSRAKKRSSIKNGQKGGRPSPDLKTQKFANELFIGLMQNNPTVWESVVNYTLPPRYLRQLVVLMRAQKITNAQLNIPAEWDPSKGSADPLKRYADFARKQGYWGSKLHPPRSFPAGKYKPPSKTSAPQTQ